MEDTSPPLSSHPGNEKHEDPQTYDVESAGLNNLVNTRVGTYRWSNCTVEVKDRATGNPKLILDDVSGEAKAGDVIALMGPSGSGKTTLLNVLARRAAATNAKVSGDLLIDEQEVSLSTFQSLASFVEQEDALIGSLTARETIEIAAHLSMPRRSTRAGRAAMTTRLVNAFGLTSCADTLIGTPIRKGISGGQKRRVSVASQLVASPKILFLDEPTSGLDSTASREVMSYIRKVAKDLKLIVIASIHQPSTQTFRLFDKLALLSQGTQCYFGPVDQVESYFENLGLPVPSHMNTAEFLLDLVNADFEGASDVARIQESWKEHEASLQALQRSTSQLMDKDHSKSSAIDAAFVMIPLLKRATMKSYRDVLAYGVRYAMYFGLAVMMGTVWLRLKTEQAYIQSFINAIFFGSAFMSFMAVAYVPAYLEDRAVFAKDRVNGLYGPTAFMLTNTIVGLPYLFGISLLFSVIAYWLSNFDPSASSFFKFVMWLFLDLVAAESLVVFVSSLIPNFVIALALVAFANGLWMSVGGFLHPIPLLNPFWKYVFHYIDYQAYVFQGMMVNEFERRTYACAEGCQCSFPTGDLTCEIPGTSVLAAYGYPLGREGKWVGIMLAIIIVYRLFGWVALYVRKS